MLMYIIKVIHIHYTSDFKNRAVFTMNGITIVINYTIVEMWFVKNSNWPIVVCMYTHNWKNQGPYSRTGYDIS